MHAPGSSPLTSDLPDIAADIFARLRARNPRVHCITNAVAQNFTANVLLAAGAIPSMTVDPVEIAEFVARADALLVNLGTLSRDRREAAEIAIEEISDERRPWVLDPVFVDRSEPRTALAKALVAKKPWAIRLNGAEFAALADAAPEDDALKRYVLRHLGVIALTGATDIVTDGARFAKIENGDPLMGQVTAMGCAGAARGGGLSGGRGRPLAGDRRRIAGVYHRGRVRGSTRARTGELCGRDHRCACKARSRHLPRAGKGHINAGDMMRVDLRLYALVDPEHAGGHALADLARLVAQGGATLVQLRDKRSDTRAMVESARAIKAALAPFNVPLLINDRVDVALASGAARRACGAGRHGGRRCAAPARARCHHRTFDQDRRPGRGRGHRDHRLCRRRRRVRDLVQG